MSPTLDTIGGFLARVAPGLLLGAALLALARRDPRARVVVYLALFVLLRDVMTPLGLWAFGTAGGFWLRLPRDPGVLAALGLSSAGMVLGLYLGDRENRALVRWVRRGVPLALSTGLAGAAVVVAPLVAAYRFVPIEARGGPVPAGILPAVLAFALAGNLLEEILFRGYVAGELARRMSAVEAGVWSGVVFAFCHLFLALTVTGVGYPLLLFTLWEGVIAGLVWWRGGSWPRR